MHVVPRSAGLAWQPSLGAWRTSSGFRFRVWAPTRRCVEVIIDPLGPKRRTARLQPAGDGTFSATIDDVAAGDRYAYLLDGDGPFPDPASRFQPDGVHAPSALVDAGTFVWSDRTWSGVALDRAVIYEIHVGTFTPAGTYAGAIERLPYLAELGITVLELMPVADFAGRRNWGYDGVSLFAPARCYGPPDDLRMLVDQAHRMGLAVMLDVVYNHFGPDGAYASQFSPFYFSTRHQTPWGSAVNLDGDHADQVRAFLIENALYWLHEFHLDGLRLDATHALVDDSPCHFARELAASVRDSIGDRIVLLMAEDERNHATIVRPSAEGGWGFDAVWADDFHHQIRRLSTGDRDGYFEDFSGLIGDVIATLRRGWFYSGQYSTYLGRARGTDPRGVSLNRMVMCLQNHDQVGNDAFGRRLNHLIDGSLYRAVSAILLFAPETPLLFMGQEWAASSAFQYFTDHRSELGRAVTEGRRAEFSRFAAFADEATRARIPDPQALSTFESSRLRWDERTEWIHAGTLDLYRALLELRHTEPALQGSTAFDAVALGDHSLALKRTAPTGDALLLIAQLSGGGSVDMHRWHALADTDSRWVTVLTTEDTCFRQPEDEEPGDAIQIDFSAATPLMTFRRPGAMILRSA